MRVVLLLVALCLVGIPALAEDYPYLVEVTWQLEDFGIYEPEDHWNQWRAVEGWGHVTATLLRDTSLMSPRQKRQLHPIAELNFDVLLGYSLREKQNMDGSTFADRGVPGWAVRSGPKVLSAGTGDADTLQSFSAGLRFVETEMVFSLTMYELQTGGLEMYAEDYEVPFVPSFWYDAQVEPVAKEKNQYRLTVTRYPEGPEGEGIPQEWIISDYTPAYLSYRLTGSAVVEAWGTGVTEAYSKPLRHWKLCRDTDQDKLIVKLRPTLNRAALLVEHGGLNGRLHNVKFEHSVTTAVWTYPWGTVSLAEGAWQDSDYRGNVSSRDLPASNWEVGGGLASFWTDCSPGYSTGLRFYQTADLMP